MTVQVQGTGKIMTTRLINILDFRDIVLVLAYNKNDFKLMSKIPETIEWIWKERVLWLPEEGGHMFICTYSTVHMVLKKDSISHIGYD